MLRMGIKFLNFVSYCVVVVSNFNASYHGSEKETYLHVDPLTFLLFRHSLDIFHLYALVRQNPPKGRNYTLSFDSFRLPISCLLYTIYLRLWLTHRYFFAGCILYPCVILLQLMTQSDDIIIRIGFATYHRWVYYLWMLSLFEAFGIDARQDSAGTGTMLSFLIAMTMFSLDSVSKKHAGRNSAVLNLPVYSIPAWLSLAIFFYQRNSGIVSLSALGFAVAHLRWLYLSWST